MNWSQLRDAWLRVIGYKPPPVPASPAPPAAPPDPMPPAPGPEVVRDTRPRGIRNKNPGNIRGTIDGTNVKLDPWRGQVGLDDKGFCIFDHEEHGVRALALLMLNYQSRHGLQTIEQLITRWAPPKGNHGRVENNTVAYIAAVCVACGVRYDDRIYLARDRHMLSQLTRAIIKHENGIQPYPPVIIDAGVRLAMESAA